MLPSCPAFLSPARLELNQKDYLSPHPRDHHPPALILPSGLLVERSLRTLPGGPELFPEIRWCPNMNQVILLIGTIIACLNFLTKDIIYEIFYITISKIPHVYSLKILTS